MSDGELVVELSDGDLLICDDGARRSAPSKSWELGKVDAHAWRMRRGQPIVMVRALLLTDELRAHSEFERDTLCDVEVRESERGRGLALQTIAAVNDAYGVTLHTSGNFTPRGLRALEGRIPLVPGAERKTRAAFRDMTFVENWDPREIYVGWRSLREIAQDWGVQHESSVVQ